MTPKYTRIYKLLNDPSWHNAVLVHWRDADGIEHSQRDHSYPKLVEELKAQGYEPSDRWNIKQPTQ